MVVAATAAANVAPVVPAAATDALGGTLAFNKPDPRAFGVLVSTPGIHGAAVAHLAERATVAMG